MFVATGIIVFDFDLFMGERCCGTHACSLFCCPHNGLSVIIGLLWSNSNEQLSCKQVQGNNLPRVDGRRSMNEATRIINAMEQGGAQYIVLL